MKLSSLRIDLSYDVLSLHSPQVHSPERTVYDSYEIRNNTDLNDLSKLLFLFLPFLLFRPLKELGL